MKEIFWIFRQILFIIILAAFTTKGFNVRSLGKLKKVPLSWPQLSILHAYTCMWYIIYMYMYSHCETNVLVSVSQFHIDVRKNSTQHPLKAPSKSNQAHAPSTRRTASFLSARLCDFRSWRHTFIQGRHKIFLTFSWFPFLLRCWEVVVFRQRVGDSKQIGQNVVVIVQLVCSFFFCKNNHVL